MHKTTILCQFGLIICHFLTNSYLNQFLSIFGGNCIILDAPPGDCGSYTAISSVSTVNLHQSSPQEPDWNALRPFFAWTSPSSIKDTFNVTTRHGTAPHTQDYIKCAVKLLQQTPSSLTPPLLMMVQPWPNFSVAVIPFCL